MANPEEAVDDVFLPSGRLRFDVIDESACGALEEAVRQARETRWDSIRTPHVFMGLLTLPDEGLHHWARRIGTDPPSILTKFREFFYQDTGDRDAYLQLSREFFSDNVIRLLRDALGRALEQNRKRVRPMDLLICILTAPNSIVGECFQQIGYTAAKLTEWAVLAEQAAPSNGGSPPSPPDPSGPTSGQ
jgi:ATP-dependent Clp protease ATP-binding subunit ClpA